MDFDRPYTLNEIAKMLNATFVGQAEVEIKGMNEIHMVRNGDLTFVDHPKYYNKALNSPATTILINKKVSCPEGKTLILSDDPFMDFVFLSKKFKIFIPTYELISKTAKIGKGTIIQPNVFIGNNVKIGKNCLIHSNVSIYDNTIIGDDTIIHSNTVLGADAFYFQKRKFGYLKLESSGRVIIKNNVEIGALCAIDKGVSSDTIIDNGTKIDNHCQIGHDTYIGKNCLIGAQAAIAGVTRIEDDVVLWGVVSVNKNIIIGKGAVVLATSAVDKSLEGDKTYFGSPAIEARKKWKELASLRRLPEIIEHL